MTRRLAVAAVLVCWWAAPVAAPQTGGIAGEVRGPEGNPLESARVLVLGTRGEAVTNSAGRFRIDGVSVGLRQVVIEYLGLRADTVTVGDEIGKLPDQNVAEAAQRVPGVSVQTSRGEGRFVSIRGTAPNLNNVVLNGQTLASTASSRATALDLTDDAPVDSARMHADSTAILTARIRTTVSLPAVEAWRRDSYARSATAPDPDVSRRSRRSRTTRTMGGCWWWTRRRARSACSRSTAASPV